jgi:uncharacterized membrane protein YfcA
VRSTLGFGEALIAVPLLAFFIPVQVAAPLAALLSVTIAGVIVVQDWRHVHWSSAGWLLLFTVAGIPVGLLLLTSGHPQAIKIALALVILAVSLFALTARKLPELRRDHKGCLSCCGFLAGVLGGAFGMNGPPLALYGATRRWRAEGFRATLQGYFLPASLAGLIGFWGSGLWTPPVTRDYLLSLPALIPAIFLGRYLNRRIPAEAFARWVYVGLAAVGVLLLSQAAVAVRRPVSVAQGSSVSRRAGRSPHPR